MGPAPPIRTHPYRRFFLFRVSVLVRFVEVRSRRAVVALTRAVLRTDRGGRLVKDAAWTNCGAAIAVVGTAERRAVVGAVPVVFASETWATRCKRFC